MVGRHQDGDGLADDLGGGVAQDPLGGLIPARDDAVERLADDGIVGGFDDRCQQPACILGPPQRRLGRASGPPGFADRLLRGVLALTSWKTRTTPWMRPPSSLMGAACRRWGVSCRPWR